MPPAFCVLFDSTNLRDKLQTITHCVINTSGQSEIHAHWLLKLESELGPQCWETMTAIVTTWNKKLNIGFSDSVTTHGLHQNYRESYGMRGCHCSLKNK